MAAERTVESLQRRAEAVDKEMHGEKKTARMEFESLNNTHAQTLATLQSHHLIAMNSRMSEKLAAERTVEKAEKEMMEAQRMVESVRRRVAAVEKEKTEAQRTAESMSDRLHKVQNEKALVDSTVESLRKCLVEVEKEKEKVEWTTKSVREQLLQAETLNTVAQRRVGEFRKQLGLVEREKLLQERTIKTLSEQLDDVKKVLREENASIPKEMDLKDKAATQALTLAQLKYDRAIKRLSNDKMEAEQAAESAKNL
ncbi:hypothetical protein HDU93_004044 [Gonapodya sp. JEL0774]|nr:hypothetical protein HDU93_004044 [Gonapodya sp. JEL0774]